MRHRWTVFLVALVASTLLAVGLGVAASRLGPSSTAPPRLQTVSAAALSRSGLTVTAAAQPAYCGAEQAAAQARWLPDGAAGCPVGRDVAEAAALRAGPGRVVESALVRASRSAVGERWRDRLAWLVVVHGGAVVTAGGTCVRTGAGIGPAICQPLAGACVQSPNRTISCPPASIVSIDRVDLVDAASGTVLTSVAVPSGRSAPPGSPIRVLPPQPADMPAGTAG
jgi:hypothetical protein